MADAHITHHHAHGSDCCPHPDCVKHEDRRVNKALAIALAKKIQANRHHEPDVQQLADLTIRLLEG